MNSLKQRVAYIKKLLSDNELSEYGFTDEELLHLVAMPPDSVIELLIHLKSIQTNQLKNKY
jgi:hypothetical protein